MSQSYIPRRILRLLEELSAIGQLRKGVTIGQLPQTSMFYQKAKGLKTSIRISYKTQNDEIDKTFFMKKRDYSVLACAKNESAILVTDDIGFISIARDFVITQKYRGDQVEINELYKGYRYIPLSKAELNEFYSAKSIPCTYNLYPNEFALFGEEDYILGIGIKKGQNILACNLDNLGLGKMKTRPANLEQKLLLYLMQDPEVLCLSVTGTSGRGKTLLCCDHAFAEVERGNYGKFLYTKSIIPTDEAEYMGFNKGTEQEKFAAHIRALYSAVEFLYREELYGPKKAYTLDERIQKLVDQDKLGLLPLANIRGMNIYKKIVLLDEAQNTKKHVMKALVSRFEDTSKLIVTGDIEQIDDVKLDMFNNGLSHLIAKGKAEPTVAHITLDIDKKDSKRGRLATFGAKSL